ncbi:MAG: NADH-quinone oxidoreductase subunit H, partial [Desulfurococcales archaeon]|nr:NADH-quinone oxidoreductase subunit H [Desulfurococcales archaeon]
IFVSTGLTSFAMLPEAAIRPSYIPVLVLLLTSAYVASGRIPFDIGEAEPELASGILIELSGPALGTALYSILMKRFVCASLSALALVLPLVRLLNPLASFAVFTALTTVMWIIHGIIAVLLGRSRVDIAAKALVLTYSILIISSTALVGVGL